jgi:hypothetical protein
LVNPVAFYELIGASDHGGRNDSLRGLNAQAFQSARLA